MVGLVALAGVVGLASAVMGVEPYSWQQQQAKALPNGDLEWAPKPFVFEKGESLKYIDFDAGNDDADGSQAHPWEHHPWDAQATGAAKACAGIHTYVFKRGVIYRGELMAAESGKPGQPIRLTSDPYWGEGEACVYGSQRVTSGWKKCTPQDAPGIPMPEKVWYNDVGTRFNPNIIRISAIWDVSGKEARRLNIARDPNWTITDPDDPVSNWYQWETFQGTGGRGILADSKHLAGRDPDFFKGGWVWTQHRWLMGTVHRVALKAYDPAKGSFEISSPGGAQYGNSPNAPAPLEGRVHYFIENVRGFLDAPGEYFYDRTGPNPGRLYLRPEDGADPNQATLEIATVKSPIQILDKSYIIISGLTFSYNDDYDDTYTLPHCIGSAPMVRVVGSCTDITVKNCKFYDVMDAVVAFPRPSVSPPPGNVGKWDIGPFANDVMDNILITDNDLRNVDQYGAICVEGFSGREPFGRLKLVEVLRNRVVNAGFRSGPSPTSSVPAITVEVPETAEIAGNIVDTSWGNGIFALGGKSSGARNDAPLSRILIHHNLAENTMLGCNDYGGLEMFQGGPGYFYDNVSRNCIGTRTFNGEELGYSLYLDGGFKIYSFNNILEGKVKPGQPDYYNNCGYFMVFGFMDHLFNNTIYHFRYGLNGSSGNRSCVLGNVVADCSVGFMIQNRPGDVSMTYGGDTGEMGRIGIATMAYGSNVFWGQPKGERNGEGAFGMVGGTSGPGQRAQTYQGKTIEELRAALEKMQCRVSQIGWQVDKMPLADPAKGDFRLAADSGAAKRGVKFFVPWGLYGMVGEWNFYKSQTAPQIVLGENFYMQPELASRDMYYYVPRNDLTVNECTPDDYVAGPLEDWIDGALRFDGKRYAVLTNAEMTKDLVYSGGGRRGGGPQTSPGSQRKTLDMSTNSFLVEAHFRTDPGLVNGTIAAKADQAGYELGMDQDGHAVVRLLQGGKAAVSLASSRAVNDGQWHHLVAEVDRPASQMRIYLDGKSDSELKDKAAMLAPDVSLANTGDFLVGKANDGRFFAGCLDFLRVSRGTLADARTTYEELYAWEFGGPFLRDFCGNQPVGKRDAGAIEYTGGAAGR
jgi:hypothetical protein